MAKEETLLHEKLSYLEGLLPSGLKINAACAAKEERLNMALETGMGRKRALRKIAAHFHVDPLLLEDEHTLEELKKANPRPDRKLEKLIALSTYLSNREGLPLYRALSLDEGKTEEYLKGERKISQRLLSKVSVYFGLPLHYLTNDEEELPLDTIKLDKVVLDIQKNDVENELKRQANKKNLARNYHVLSHAQRRKLLLTSLLVALPLLGYTSYCAYTLIEDRISSTSEFIAEQTLTEKEKEVIRLQDELLRSKGKEKYQTEVKVAVGVANIKNVSNSGMSFSPTMEVYFDFDHEDYFRMIYNRENNADFDERSSYLSDPKYMRDDFGYNISTGEFFKHGDSVPDYMQLEGYAVDDPSDPHHCAGGYKAFVDTLYDVQNADGTYSMSDATWDALMVGNFEMAQIYSKVIAQYPGETTTNVYPDKEGIFSIGHYSGSFNADEFSYGISTPYTLTDEDGNVEYRYFQSCYFSATIAKVYDSPRYPLDSVSFTIPVTAEKLTYEYLKYVPVDYIDLTIDQTLANADPAVSEKKACSFDGNVFLSGTNPGFKISTAYKLFNSGDIKDISKKVVLRYFTESDSEVEEISDAANDPSKVFYYSEFQLIMHANRAGISLFLQAFINLFAVVIWIVIAFYDQSYHGESAIGMLGTGLFGAISSILVGLSMISEAGMFSLITMINVFTLAVILIMTVSSINAKRAKILGDPALVAYSVVKMRILFAILTLCTAVMLIGLPLASFIFY